MDVPGVPDVESPRMELLATHMGLPPIVGFMSITEGGRLVYACTMWPHIYVSIAPPLSIAPRLAQAGRESDMYREALCRRRQPKVPQ
jgi:hypothetical protein